MCEKGLLQNSDLSWQYLLTSWNQCFQLHYYLIYILIPTIVDSPAIQFTFSNKAMNQSTLVLSCPENISSEASRAFLRGKCFLLLSTILRGMPRSYAAWSKKNKCCHIRRYRHSMRDIVIWFIYKFNPRPCWKVCPNISWQIHRILAAHHIWQETHRTLNKRPHNVATIWYCWFKGRYARKRRYYTWRLYLKKGTFMSGFVPISQHLTIHLLVLPWCV